MSDLLEIGIVPNLEKTNSSGVVLGILSWLENKGYRGWVTPCTATAMGIPGHSLPVKSWKNRLAFAIVLGGDGTLLGAARVLGPLGIPILGVNMGHFGFLTEMEIEGLYQALPVFIEGRVKEDKRLTLDVKIKRNGKTVWSGLALNEASIIKRLYGRMAVLSVKVSGKIVDKYFGDGVIVSTPTGSTAYSLSAGGPLLSPGIDAIVITPVCAHTLYSRSIVVPGSEICGVEIGETSQHTVLTVDGQEFFPLARGDEILISRSPVDVVLLRRENWSFYDVLRAKMKEGAERIP